MSKRLRAITVAGGLTAAVLCIIAAVRTGEAEKPGHERPVASPRPAVGKSAKQPVPAPPAADTRAPRYQGALIKGVPHVRQKPDFCGEACAAMFLQKLGRPVDQDYVFDCSGLDPMEARGCYTKELAAALRNIGFETGAVWHQVEAARHAAGMESQWRAVHADLAAGVPSIVCMHYDEGPQSSEHFRLILGYDSKTDEVIYHEPAEADGAYRRMKRDKLLRLWPLKYDAKTWTVVRMALKPGPRVGRAAYPASAAGTHTSADYAQHLVQLKPKVPEGFTIVLERPFFVIGDETPAMVRRRAVGTVKWAVDKLKAAYFTKDPADVLDIWLFKDKASYEKHTKAIFNYRPSTPFGYFSHTDKALVMNIATGGGTLVHEIVHPFVASNFPECPAWLNEGLGSLYEQSSERNGKIVGLTNWRLAGLQKAIRAENVPSFLTLCTTSQHQFYHEDPGTNYG